MAEGKKPSFPEIFGNKKNNTLTNSKKGFVYMSGREGSDKYIITDISKGWTEVNDKNIRDNDEEYSTLLADPNAKDSILLKNISRENIALFFDVHNPEIPETDKTHPEDTLYIIKKEMMDPIVDQFIKILRNEIDETSEDALQTGAVEIPFYFGDTNNATNGSFGTKYDANYIHTIQTDIKGSKPATLEIEKYIATVKKQVVALLKGTNYATASQMLSSGNDAEKKALLDIFRNAEMTATIYGTDGKDTLRSATKNDVLIGGKGNDKLYGGNSSTLLFDSGDGNDTVYSGVSNAAVSRNGDDGDTLKFNDANSIKDLRVNVKGYNLVIKHGDGFKDSVTLSNYVKADGTSSIKRIAFSDGSTIDLWKDGTLNKDIPLEVFAEKPNKKAKLTGSILSDKITGTDFNDTIKGGAGDDTIIGGLGNDKLYGEAGKNKFEFTFNGKDGFGDDIIYNGNSKKTSANDTLVFKDANKNISFDDLSFFKTGNDLKITYDYKKAGANQGSVTVKDYFKANVDHSVKSVEIGEESKSIADLIKTNIYTEGKGKINGTNNNDIIFGSDKKDTINSLAGDDVIYTGAGNDTIVFNTLGENVDHKEITSTGGINTLQMSKWNVLEEELEFSYNKNEKSMTIRGFGQTETNGNDEYYNNNFELKINNFNNDYTIVDNKKKKYSLLAGEENINGTKGNDIIISAGDGKTISTGAAGNNYVTLMGTNNIVNIGAGNTEIYHTDANGKEFFEEGYTKKNSNDTYNVNVFNKKTSVAILGDNDGNDTLNINGSAKDMRILFNVNKDGSFNTDDYSLCIYHKSSSYNKFADLDSWFLPGVEMDWDFGGNNTIETVKARGQQINMDAWIDAVKTDVASWLDKNGYGSTEEVIGKENNAADIKALLNVYQQFDGAKYLM